MYIYIYYTPNTDLPLSTVLSLLRSQHLAIREMVTRSSRVSNPKIWQCGIGFRFNDKSQGTEGLVACC